MSLIIPPKISWKNLECGIVLLNLVNGVYYTLNETASFILQGVIDGLSENEIIAKIVEEYDCEEELAAQDVHKQLAFLLNEELLEKSNV
jgi:hypothetical protein